ncbi:MAG: UvrD-helicase domain-containing protein [Clostridiales bacterium]|nr:UvrD-helicase domain-containing protein [Clostridiales bacterium]
MPKFNTDQQKAIEADNPRILVSAAAGSGKTTVMVHKILHTLKTDPKADISQFLVITFTRDAARNMKNKLHELLEEDGSPEAAKALSEIETASISTIHSFCQTLLKEYSDNRATAAEPRVMKESEQSRLKEESFGDAVEKILGKNSAYAPEDRRKVSHLLTAFSTEELTKMVLDLYDVLMGIPRPLEALHHLAECPPSEEWQREILRAADLDVIDMREKILKEEELLQSPLAAAGFKAVYESDRAVVEGFFDKWDKTPDMLQKRALLESTRDQFGKAPATREKDESIKAWKKAFNDIRSDLKGSEGVLRKAMDRLDLILAPDQERRNGIIREELQGLETLVREVTEFYRQKKEEAGVIDYADMEQSAYEIMSDPDKCAELLAKYRYVFVDECQDVSAIQDAIIQPLSGPGHQLFMVGDVKQSIYGFRNANPSLFQSYREHFRDDEKAEERRIFFVDNYRSCRAVVECVNEVFDASMDRLVTEMDYLPQDHLRANVSGEYGPVDVILVNRNDEEAEQLEAQCEAVGRYIRSLVVPPEDVSSVQTYSYSDIVILLKVASGVASKIVDHLRKMHIPAVYEGGLDFYGLSEIKAFLALLTVIDNLHNDDDLVGALIHPPFSFTDEDNAQIRMEFNDKEPFYRCFERCAERNDKEIDRKCRAALDQIREWTEAASRMSVPDFVWWLMRESGIYASRGAYPDGKTRQANLDVLYQRAVDGEKAGQIRLTDFVREMQEARETRMADSDDHPTMGIGENYVRIMTMHKSKGLEFPCVILMNLQKSVRQGPVQSRLRMNLTASGEENPALGLYLPMIRRRTHSMMDTYGKDAFGVREQRVGIAENTRLLYVAMTRAMKRLCLVGSIKAGDERLWTDRIRAARIWKTRSMLDMIMPAVVEQVDLPGEGKSITHGDWRISVFQPSPIEDSDDLEESTDVRIQRILAERPKADVMYLPEEIEEAPVKTSVSSLIQQRKTGTSGKIVEEEETVEDKRKSETELHTYRLSPVASRPAFLEEEKVLAVDVGSTTHRFLRLVDLEMLRNPLSDYYSAVRDEAEHLEQAGIMTHEETARIRFKGVAAFFESELGQRMLASRELHREWKFAMQITDKKPTIVQGIIDVAFLEEDAWVLLDYKTDWDTKPENFVPRHEMQMNWYRVALERLTGRPVREMWLYALRSGTACRVSVLDPTC